jgi:hypothetical protein
MFPWRLKLISRCIDWSIFNDDSKDCTIFYSISTSLQSSIFTTTALRTSHSSQYFPTVCDRLSTVTFCALFLNHTNYHPELVLCINVCSLFPYFRAIEIPLRYTTFEDSSGRVISPSQKLYLIKHNADKKESHDLGESQTHNTSNQGTVESRLRQRGHRDLLLRF